MPETLVSALVGLLGIGIGSGISYLAVRKKNDSDAAEAVANAASVLLEPLTNRVTVLEKKTASQDCTIRRYGNRVIYLMGGIKTLLAQITGLGHEPAWTPSEWNPDEEE